MNWLDWLIVIIIGLSTLQGLRRGLLAGVAKMAGLFVALYVAYTYYRPVTSLLSERWHFEEILLPLAGPLFKFWQPVEAFNPFNPSGNLTAGDYVARFIALSLLEVLTFIALLLVTVWLVNLAGMLFTRIADISFLGPLNHLGGLLFGFLKGVLLVTVIVAVMNLLPGDRLLAPGSTGRAGSTLENSMLLPYFRPLLNIIEQSLPGIIPHKIISPEQIDSI